MICEIFKRLPLMIAATVSIAAYAATDSSLFPNEGEILASARPFKDRQGSRASSNDEGDGCKPRSCEDTSCERATFTSLPQSQPPCQDPCCPPMVVYNHNINPTARRTQANYDMFATVDFIYWKTEEDPLALAFVNTSSTSANIGSVRNVNFNWDPGFKLGFGWNIPFDHWDALINWTWYKNKSSTTVFHPTSATPDSFGTSSATPEGVHPIQPTFVYRFPPDGAVDVVNPAVNRVESNYQLHYNMIDLELGRSYYVSSMFSMRPTIGLRGGAIHRRHHIEKGVPNASLDNSDILRFYPLHIISKTHYWGIGPRFGIDSNWSLGWGFELFGNFSSSFLYGRVSKNQTEVENRHTGDQIANIRNENHLIRVVPNLQSVLGLGWGNTFFCDTVYLGLRAGWEFNHFWGIQRFTDVSSTLVGLTPERTLNLSGLTLNTRVEF